MKVVTLYPPAVAVEYVRPPPGLEIVIKLRYLRMTMPEPPFVVLLSPVAPFEPPPPPVFVVPFWAVFRVVVPLPPPPEPPEPAFALAPPPPPPA